MTKLAFPIVIFCLLFTQLAAQITFNKRYDMYSSSEAGGSIIAESDGYFNGVLRVNDTTGYWQTVFSKIDLDGNLLWVKEMKSDTMSVIMSSGSFIKGGEDGVYYACGRIISSLGSDYMFLKMSNTGDTLFTKVIQTPKDELAYMVKDVGDGFVILSSQLGGINYQILLTKIDSDGNELWRNIFGGGMNYLPIFYRSLMDI